MDFSLWYTFQFQLKWVRLDQITANFVIITIYGIKDRSHDQTNKIFELSLKNGVRLIYNITRSYSLLPYSHLGNTLPRSKLSMNEWMNEWKKSLSSEMIKNESYFVRTRNITSLVHIHFCPIPMLEILCYRPTYKSINQWMKKVTKFWNDKEQVLLCKNS